MPRTIFPVALLLALAASAGASDTTAGRLALAPRYAPGDAYELSLTTDTETASAASGARGFAETVRIAYRANVVVLEVDGDGRPVRERHDAVRLDCERPEGCGSLFRPGAGFEVRRSRNGALELHQGGRRLDRALEKVVTDLLATRLEHTPLPALLDPGRPIAAGESWTLDRGLAKRLLRERGLRVVDFGDEPATARLEGDGDARRLRYRIPVAWLELARMPADARTAGSRAILEGELALAPDGRARGHDARLTLEMTGVLVKSGVAAPRAWRLATAQSIAQRNEPLARVAISGL